MPGVFLTDDNGYFPALLMEIIGYSPGPGILEVLSKSLAVLSVPFPPIEYFTASEPKSFNILYFPGPGTFLSNTLLVS